jgi:hypothetical protein
LLMFVFDVDERCVACGWFAQLLTLKTIKHNIYTTYTSSLIHVITSSRPL